MVVFAGFGMQIVQNSRADQPVAVEAESGELSGSVLVKPLSGASNGSVIQFGSGVSNNDARGFGMSVPNFVWMSPAQQTAALTDMKSLGISWIRFDIDWAAVQETSSSGYDWAAYDSAFTRAQQHGIKVMGIIDYAPVWAKAGGCPADKICPPADLNAYANYSKAVVQHFGDRLGAVEIWNEPNIAGFWYPQADAATYTQMLKLSSVAIRTVDPDITIISGGLSPACTCDGDIAPLDFAAAMYAGGAKDAFNAFGYHPYSFPAPPSDNQPWSAWSQMSQTTTSIRSIMAAAGDATKPLWMTEVGAPTNGPGPVATCTDFNYDGGPDHTDECLQSRIIVEAATLTKSTSWAGVTFFYTYQDGGTDTSTVENFFGLLRADGSQKPAYGALKTIINN